jgi:hypothetical protein
LHSDDQSEDDGTELIKHPDLGQQMSSDRRPIATMRPIAALGLTEFIPSP